MSAARYIIQLKVGDMTISRKLKTVLGDTEGLQHEVARLLEEDAFKSLAEALTDKYGGLAAAQEKWIRDQEGWCDGCGNHFKKTEFTVISNSNLAGIVLCPKCSK